MTNDAKDAFLFYSVDGNWSDWKDWSDCPVTCGGGVQNRSRTCTNPPPKYGGVCIGPGVQTKTCLVKRCPGQNFCGLFKKEIIQNSEAKIV